MYLTAVIPGPFQSTHSRGVRLIHIDGQLLDQHISIHALTRSATESDFPFDTADMISIHALTRSATQILDIVLLIALFQSTHSRGVRLSTTKL